jgi:hypothetical protein
VTAGFANDVEAVNQKTAVMHAPTVNGTALDLQREQPQITHIRTHVPTNSLNTWASPLRAWCEKKIGGRPNMKCATTARFFVAAQALSQPRHSDETKALDLANEGGELCSLPETIGGVVNEQAENVEASGLRQRRKRINGL